MKLVNPSYVNDAQRKEFIKELNLELNLTLNIFHLCSSIVVRKDNTDYVLKDRWQSPYATDKTNLGILSEKDFLIVSRQLLSRVTECCRYGEIIYNRDNLIIEI